MIRVPHLGQCVNATGRWGFIDSELADRDKGAKRLHLIRGTNPPSFAPRYARRVEGDDVACFEEYAVPLNVEQHRAIWSERGFQPAEVAVMRRRWFARLGILYEMMTLKSGIIVILSLSARASN